MAQERTGSIAFRVTFTPIGEQGSTGARRSPDGASQERLRREFWDYYFERNESRERPSIEALEERLRTGFALSLTRSVGRGLSYGAWERRPHPEFEDEFGLPFAFKVEALNYGSLTVCLGLVGAETALRAVEDNLELLEELIYQNAMDGLNSALPGQVHDYFECTVSTDSSFAESVLRRPRGRKPRTSSDSNGRSDRAEEGAEKPSAILPQLLRVALDRSPFFIAFLLMVFLWYSSQQDALADRQILSAMVQSFAREQTETLEVLKSAATDLQKEHGNVATAQTSAANKDANSNSPKLKAEVK